MRTSLAALPLLALLAAGCADTGPTDLKDVCAAYKVFDFEYGRPHPLSNKGIFTSMKRLGDVASRYPDDAQIRSSGARLKEMGDSGSVNLMELVTVVSSIRGACT